MASNTDEKRKMQEAMEQAKSKEHVKSLLSMYSDVASPKALCLAFEKLFIDESTGFSRAVTIDELVLLHKDFKTSNGMSWCRSDTSYLGKKYVIIREQRGGSVYSVKADGFKKAIHSSDIRPDILRTITRHKCSILDVSSMIECDHKDGMKNDLSVATKESQKLSDFQALSKAANDAKRQHCKNCRITGKRYDAKRLGYKHSFTHGNENSKVCVGCYWYDPKKFNEEISSSFEKND